MHTCIYIYVCTHTYTDTHPEPSWMLLLSMVSSADYYEDKQVVDAQIASMPILSLRQLLSDHTSQTQ